MAIFRLEWMGWLWLAYSLAVFEGWTNTYLANPDLAQPGNTYAWEVMGGMALAFARYWGNFRVYTKSLHT
jgi:peptidoglycan/LPS O-acetylase OafA/YrhL